jgi:hypothetical protein
VSPRRPEQKQPSILAAFVDQSFDFQAAEGHAFSILENVGDGFGRGFARRSAAGLFGIFREGFQSTLDNFFGRPIRTISELLL